MLGHAPDKRRDEAQPSIALFQRGDSLVETYFWIDDESGDGRLIAYSKVLRQSLINRL